MSMSAPLTTPVAMPAAVATAGPAHVDVGGHHIGRDTFTVIAGPCSVTSFDQTLRVAQAVEQAGATMLRGGAYKPRTDPRSFQGLAELGLAMLLEAKAATGLMIVTELLDVRDLELVLTVADIVQVGARNMQNTGLLRELGRAGCPVLLKRGLAATIDETIGAAEYIRCEGNHDVMLCERGIRTFERRYRFSLDLTAVPIMQERSGLPVLVDPSHAPGRRDLVLRLSKAAAAVGADGLIVEVDESPDQALSDGPQQLSSDTFADYMREVHRVACGEGRAL
jgi:3-deoxy-7-phosphoheptulonate synthase